MTDTPERDPTRTEDVEEALEALEQLRRMVREDAELLADPDRYEETICDALCTLRSRLEEVEADLLHTKRKMVDPEEMYRARRRADRLEEALEEISDVSMDTFREDSPRLDEIYKIARSALDSREDEGEGDSSVLEGQKKAMSVGVHWCPNGETLRRYPAVVCSMCRPGDPNVVHYSPIHADEPEGDEPSAILPKYVVDAILAARDALVEEDVNEAYHHLYQLAETYAEDPFEPWANLEDWQDSYSQPTDEPVSGEGDRGGPLDQLVALLRVDRRDLNHGHTVGKYACRKCGPLGGEMSALDCLDAEHIVYGPFRTEPIAEKVMGLIDHQFRDATHADARSEEEEAEHALWTALNALIRVQEEYDLQGQTAREVRVTVGQIDDLLSDRHEDEGEEALEQVSKEALWMHADRLAERLANVRGDVGEILEDAEWLVTEIRGLARRNGYNDNLHRIERYALRVRDLLREHLPGDGRKDEGKDDEWLDPPLHEVCGERHFPNEDCPEAGGDCTCEVRQRKNKLAQRDPDPDCPVHGYDADATGADATHVDARSDGDE